MRRHEAAAKVRALIAAGLIALLSMLLPSAALAQNVKIYAGVTYVSEGVAFCKLHDDASTLLEITTRYGQQTGKGFMQEENNSCEIATLRFTAGNMASLGKRDRQGTKWIILSVTISKDDGASLEGYIVMHADAFAESQSL